MSKERPTPDEIFGFTEREKLYDRISDTRFRAILADEATQIHEIDLSTNNYGEFLFVTVSRPSGGARTYVSFWGLGYHESRERWLIDEWRWYGSHLYRQQDPPPVLSKEEATEQITARRDEIAPHIGKTTQSKRAQLFELLADLTDEDGAYTELEDLDFFDEDE